MTPRLDGVRLALSCAAMFLAASGAGISTAVLTGIRPAQELLLSVPLLGLSFVLLVSYRRVCVAAALPPWSRWRKLVVAVVLLAMAGIGMMSVLVPVLSARWSVRHIDIERDVRAHERVLRGVLSADCAGAIGIVDAWQPLTTGGAIAKKGVLLQLYSGFHMPSSAGRDSEVLHRSCVDGALLFEKVNEMAAIGEREAATWEHVPVIGGALKRYAELIIVNQREWCEANGHARCDLLPETPATPPVVSPAVKKEVTI